LLSRGCCLGIRHGALSVGGGQQPREFTSPVEG
jgi:hypothetical protein